MPQPIIHFLAPLSIPPPAVPFAAPHGQAGLGQQYQEQQSLAKGVPAAIVTPKPCNHAHHAAQLSFLHSQVPDGQSSLLMGEEDREAAAHLLALKSP